MSNIKVVKPKYMKGYSHSWNLNIFSGPKFTIICGSCEHTFTKRVTLINNPKVLCEACGTLNELPLVLD